PQFIPYLSIAAPATVGLKETRGPDTYGAVKNTAEIRAAPPRKIRPLHKMAKMQRYYALSVKQPWAALLLHGRKTIEVRRWTTARRGRILIHAARNPDPRPEVWAKVSDELRATAALVGGIIGAVDLTDCKTYGSRADFAADLAAHLNDPSWFEPPAMYGFVLARPRLLSFRACPGWFRFF